MFQTGVSDWAAYRNIPNVAEVDLQDVLHSSPAGLDAVHDRALIALRQAHANGHPFVILRHGYTPKSIAAASVSSTVRKLIRSSESTPYVVKHKSVQFPNALVAAIRGTEDETLDDGDMESPDDIAADAEKQNEPKTPPLRRKRDKAAFDPIEFGKRLRWARQSAEIGLDEAAALMGMGEDEFASYESGKALPNPDTIIAFADITAVSTDYLLGRVEDGLGDREDLKVGVQMHATRKMLQRLIESHQQAMADYAIALHSQKAQINDDAEKLVKRAKGLIEAFRTMRRLNPQFDDEIRNGARLQAEIDGLEIELTGLEIYAEQAARAKKMADLENLLSENPKLLQGK